MHFPLFLLFVKNCGKFFTAIIHIPHCTAQMMDSERAGMLLASVLIYLRLMQNYFVWFLAFSALGLSRYHNFSIRYQYQ